MRCLVVFLILSFTNLLLAQVQINEICTSNEITLFDEFNDAPDWIELYNTSNQTIDLTGYYLSDDEEEPLKWQFPELQISANQFLIIFASDRDTFDVSAHTNFKLSKGGEPVLLSNEKGELIYEIFVPPSITDFSYGRVREDSEVWKIFQQPTPNEKNDNGVTIEQSNAPEVPEINQFQTGPFEIILNQVTDDIYYTLDGSVPEVSSIPYSGPISIDTTTTIRFRKHSPDKLPSRIITRTYFVEAEHSLPIVAITSDPVGLFDFEQGIFQLGPNANDNYPFYGANFWRDTVVHGHMEYFKGGQFECNFDIGIKIHGGKSARTKPMKTLRLIADQKYGNAKMTYPFFEGKENDSYTRLLLRNASGDFNNAHMRDPYLAKYFLQSKVDLDGVAAQPVVAYVNGAYFGVMYLREKIDRFYIKDNYNIPIGKIDLLEEDTMVVEGDFASFNTMYEYVINNDLSQDFHYQKALTFFDLSNMMDYFIVQTAINNIDWPNNNLKYWRERDGDGKWRYILFDMDAGMGQFSFTQAFIDLIGLKLSEENNKFINLLKAFLQNTQCKNLFLNRYADLLNTMFKSEIFTEATDEAVLSIENEMKTHLLRWPTITFDEWRNVNLQKLYQYIDDRPAFARTFLQNEFNLSGEVLIELETVPRGAGKIKLNTIEPDLTPTWNGYYFSDIPIDLEANPIAGFRFSHWESDHTILQPMENERINIRFDRDDQIRAVFIPLEHAPKIISFRNPVVNQISFDYSISQLTDLVIRIFHADGQLVFYENIKGISPGTHQFFTSIGHLNSGVYTLEMQDRNGRGVKKFVKIY